MTSAQSVRVSASGRKAHREIRRQQLIEATIDTLATRGYADTTLAEVARRAGLSSGIVNFHFATKEKLLVETLQYLSEEYRNNWRLALDRAGPSPAERLAAVVASDFDRKICTRRKLAAWCAFWGEAKTRPDYLKHCGANDEAFQNTLADLCAELVAEGGYADYDHARIARGLDALLEGLWLKLLTAVKDITRQEARATALSWLGIVFGKHFTAEGGLMVREGEPR